MHQSGNDDEQHAYYRYRGLTDTRERLFRVQHTGDVQDAYCAQEHHVRAHAREQQHAEHRKHRDERDPGIYAKTTKHK